MTAKNGILSTGGKSMRVVSTQLRMTENFTSDEYFSVIIKWLKDSSPCRGVGELFEQSDSKESTRVVAGYCTLETVTADKDGAHYHLAKLSHIFHEQTWETGIILKSADPKHPNRSYIPKSTHHR